MGRHSRDDEDGEDMPVHERFEPMYQGGMVPHDTTPIEKPRPDFANIDALKPRLDDRPPPEGNPLKLPPEKPRAATGPWALVLALLALAVATVALTVALMSPGYSPPAQPKLTSVVPPPPPPPEEPQP